MKIFYRMVHDKMLVIKILGIDSTRVIAVVEDLMDEIYLKMPEIA